MSDSELTAEDLHITPDQLRVDPNAVKRTLAARERRAAELALHPDRASDVERLEQNALTPKASEVISPPTIKAVQETSTSAPQSPPVSR